MGAPPACLVGNKPEVGGWNMRKKSALVGRLLCEKYGCL